MQWFSYTVLLGALDKNWPPLEFTRETNVEQHMTRVTAKCC